jgi:hypothetical protein
VPTRAASPYRGLTDADPKGIRVRSAGLEPATSRPSTWSLCQLEYEHVEPPSGADPDHPPYEGGAAAVRGGVVPGQGLEPQ